MKKLVFALTLEAIMAGDKTHRFMGPKLKGRWGEVIDVFKNEAHAGLQLRINGERDLYDRSFSFEYG